jgi:hypothetical protein
MEIINLAERRKAKESQDKPPISAVDQENIIDFLATTIKCVALDGNITEAVVFLRDPATGQYMPGATSQEVMEALLQALESPHHIKAIPDIEDEQ